MSLDHVVAIASILSDVGTVILACCGIWVLIVAVGQLKALLLANQEALKTERARFLFNVDEMFENWHFSVSRAAFAEAVEAIIEEVDQNHKGKPLEERRKIQSARFSEVLFALKRENPRQYTRIMKLCGFFETLQILIDEGYIEEAKIIALYEPAILRVAMATEMHIKSRQEADGYIDGKYMENFLKLAKKTREIANQR